MVHIKIVSDDGYTFFAKASHSNPNRHFANDWNDSLAQAKASRIDWSIDDDLLPNMKDKGWTIETIPTIEVQY